MKITQIIKESDVHNHREFNSQEIKYESVHENNPIDRRYYNPNQPAVKPTLLGMYIYNVVPDREDMARSAGLTQTQSGKWVLKKYDTSGNTFNSRKRKADVWIGKGTWWEPSKTEETELDEGPRWDKVKQTAGSIVGGTGRALGSVAKGAGTAIGGTLGGIHGAVDAMKHGYQVGRGTVGGAGAPVNAQQAAQWSANNATQTAAPSDSQSDRFAQANAGQSQQAPAQTTQPNPQQTSPQQAAQEKLNAKKVMGLIGTLNKNQQQAVLNQLSKLIAQPTTQQTAPTLRTVPKDNVQQTAPVSSRPQGGGKVPGQLSQSPGAVAKRAARATAAPAQNAAESYQFESKFLGIII